MKNLSDTIFLQFNTRLLNLKKKTYLPDYVHREGSDEKITVSTVVHKMFRFP